MLFENFQGGNKKIFIDFSSPLGVNSINLCLPNCTWVEQYSEDLYPLDAGIDSGMKYTVGEILIEDDFL